MGMFFELENLLPVVCLLFLAGMLTSKFEGNVERNLKESIQENCFHGYNTAKSTWLNYPFSNCTDEVRTMRRIHLLQG